MWLVATYAPVAAFSLRTSSATSSGGRTNLVPSFYSVKLALVDAAFRAGRDGERAFLIVRDLEVRLRPPKEAVVNHLLVKIQKEDRKGLRAYAPSVALREFVWYRGDLDVAFDVDPLTGDERSELAALCPLVNYLGKRGGFVQFRGLSTSDAAPGPGFCVRLAQSGVGPVLPAKAVLQYLDDLTPAATFKAVNTFSEERMRLGKDRILVPVILPYQQTATSRGYARYVLAAAGL